jgi:hypothetical protein
MADKQRSNISDKGNNLAGYTSIAPAPKSAPGKSNVEKPVGKTTTANPLGRRYLEPIGPKMPGKTRGLTLTTKPKSIPRTFLPTVRPPVVAPVVKKPPAAAKPATRGSKVLTQNSTVSNKPPATRFGTVTGKTTGTRVSGGGGYGGGGTRGGGSLSGGGSGTRSSGTSRTGGTQRNDPVRG